MKPWNRVVVFVMLMTAVLATTLTAQAEVIPQTHDEFIAAAQKAQNAGEHQLAISLYNKAIKIDAKSKQARFGKIISYDALEDFKAIIKIAGEIIKIDNGDTDAYYIRGISYIHMQPYKISNYKMAYKDLSLVIERKPDFDEAWIDRGLSWAGQQKFDKALEDINHAIKLKESGRAYRARATVYRL